MARPSQQQPTQTVVVLSPCLHVSYAAAFLCAARQRWRSRLAYLCCGQSSMPALERRHRTLLKLRRQAQDRRRRARDAVKRPLAMGSSYLQQMTVYRSLRPRSSSRVD